MILALTKSVVHKHLNFWKFLSVYNVEQKSLEVRIIVTIKHFL